MRDAPRNHQVVAGSLRNLAHLRLQHAGSFGDIDDFVGRRVAVEKLVTLFRLHVKGHIDRFGRHMDRPILLHSGRQLTLPKDPGPGASKALLGSFFQDSRRPRGAIVARHIDPNIGESSRKKTRSTIVGLFRKIGSLEQNGSSRDPLQVRRTQPTPLAFGWVIAEQLRQTPDREVTEQWAALSSDAMALFTPTEDFEALFTYVTYEERCETHVEYSEEERFEGYDVTYVYGGQTYSTRTADDPGEQIRVWISIRPAG